MRPLKVYACGIATDYELGHTDVTVWPSVEALKRNVSCWEECGIVELTLSDPCMVVEAKPREWK